MEKILTIDDDKLVTDTLQRYLGSRGYVIEVARDGEEGLVKAVEFIPNIILLDVVMPRLDGLAVIKKLKENPVTQSIPVIMLTNLSSEETVKKAFKEGSTDFLVKVNYSLEALEKKIREVLDQKSS